MRPLLTRAEARAMDAHAVDVLGIPSLLLMENAGRGAADLVRALFPASLRHVVLVGGTGQNGGDAWVVARHLAIAGVRTTSFMIDPEGRGAVGDASVMLAIARRTGLEVHALAAPDAAFDAALASASLIVDGLFGTGLARPVVDAHAAVVARLAQNESLAPVVALDLPSGIDADTGAVLGVAVRAAATLTFGAHKRGLLQGEGRKSAGAIHVVSIGSPLSQAAGAAILEQEDLRAHLPPRARDAHKGTAGHVLIVAGSAGTTGAALLAARGAARAGAGLVTLAAEPAARLELDRRVLETMTREFGTLAALLALAENKRSVVVGPGLGLGAAQEALVLGLVLGAALPVVLDADALTLVARFGLERLRDSASVRVLTPHPAEAGVLLGVPTAEVQRDRHAAAGELAARSGQVVVLKGAGTIVAGPEGVHWVVDRGTPALGTGGSGDVLAGILGALVTRDHATTDAAIGAYWHALAGETAAATDRGLLASEIADALPRTLAAIRAASGPAFVP